MHWMMRGLPGMHLLWWLLGAGLLLLLIGALDWLRRGPTRREQRSFAKQAGVRGGVFAEHDPPLPQRPGSGRSKEPS